MDMMAINYPLVTAYVAFDQTPMTELGEGSGLEEKGEEREEEKVPVPFPNFPKITLVEGIRTKLKVKGLPHFALPNQIVAVPSEYAKVQTKGKDGADVRNPSQDLFDLDENELDSLRSKLELPLCEPENIFYPLFREEAEPQPSGRNPSPLLPCGTYV